MPGSILCGLDIGVWAGLFQPSVVLVTVNDNLPMLGFERPHAGVAPHPDMCMINLCLLCHQLKSEYISQSIHLNFSSI